MIIDVKDLEVVRGKHAGKKIVFCSGVFDLTHIGHIIFFEHCKKLGDILFVAVGGDAFVRKRKGQGRPILNERIRVRAVDSLKPVDYVFLDNLSDEEDPFKVFKLIGEHLKPDIYVARKDAFNLEERKKIFDQHSIPLHLLEISLDKDFDWVSTTALIKKIKSQK